MILGVFGGCMLGLVYGLGARLRGEWFVGMDVISDFWVRFIAIMWYKDNVQCYA